MMAREMRPRLLSKMLALGPDKTFGQESGAHSGEEFESVVCPPEGIWTESWTCHVPNGGVLYEVATCAFRGGPYNAPLLTQLFWSGRKDGLKMMPLAHSFLFWGLRDTWC